MPKLRWYQYSLRSLMLFVLACSIMCSWLAVALNRAARQREAARELRAAGFTIEYDGAPANPKPGPRAGWLRTWLGDDLFDGVLAARVSNDPAVRLRVTDDTLRAFDDLPTLRQLDLTGTPVADAGLQHLRQLAGLTSLCLDDTKIGDAGLAQLENLTGLVVLRLSNTRVTDQGMRHLRQMVALRRLSLDGCPIRGAGLKHLKGMSVLDWLSLDKTHVDDDGLAQLADLKNLTILWLADTRVTDRGVKHLAELTGLEQLELGRTRVSDAGLLCLSRLANLKQLGLSGTQITRAGLSHLAPLTSLRQLNLTGTTVTYDDAVALQDSLPCCEIKPGVGTARRSDQRAPGAGATLTIEVANPAVTLLTGAATDCTLEPVLPPDRTIVRPREPWDFPGLKNPSWGITGSGAATWGGKARPPIHCFTISEKATGKAMKWYVQVASYDNHGITRSAIGWDGDYLPGVFLVATNFGRQARFSSPDATRNDGTMGGAPSACIRIRFRHDPTIRFIFVSFDDRGVLAPAVSDEESLAEYVRGIEQKSGQAQ